MTPLVPPVRLTTQEVCALARISRATLWRRVQARRLPSPVDHARQALFDAPAVYAALSRGMDPTNVPDLVARRVAELARRRGR